MRIALGIAAVAVVVAGAAKTGGTAPTRWVGGAGEPAFGDGGAGDCIWRGVADDPVGFVKDPHGFVHLEGSALVADGTGGDARCNFGAESLDGVIFVLPPGYRPANVESFPARRLIGNEPAVVVAGTADTVIGLPPIPPLPAGAVFASDHRDGSGASLSGIVFRAG
jgi:hypothetical protein